MDESEARLLAVREQFFWRLRQPLPNSRFYNLYHDHVKQRKTNEQHEQSLEGAFLADVIEERIDRMERLLADTILPVSEESC
jgi:hypothetical protein